MSKQMKEIKKLSAADREKRLSDVQLQLMKERAQVSAGAGSKKTSSIRNAKKTIARLLTVRNE